MGLTTRKYDILTRIAVGNGALVYRAVDKVTNRQVALKLLVQDGDLDHRFNVDALLADSAKLTAITGAHVCQLLDAHTDEDGPVLIYEFANGVSGMELPSRRKLEPVHALDIAAQLMSALRSGERQRRPHGDTKPSNIVFVDLPDGRLFTLVLDWGLTAYRTVPPDDSLPFHAPERLAGGPASHRADLFSVGAVLFYLYTGKLIVAGATREELLAAWQRARPAVLAEMRPDLPAKLVQWVCSLVELTPEKRPASAVEAAAALTALNPPPPPVPPETIRPRSSQMRPPVPPGSGIAKSPTASSAPRPSQIPAVSPSAARPASQPAAKAPTPAKLSHVAMTVGLFIFLVLLVSASVWFVFFRKAEPEYLGRQVPDAPGKSMVERPPSPSVGRAIAPKLPTPQLTASAARPPVSPIPLAAVATGPAPAAAPKPPPPTSKRPAQLIASDGFEYSGRKSINGMKGGDGWAGPWKGLLATAEGESLEAKRFPARGASLVIPPAEKEVTISRVVGTSNRFGVDPKRDSTWFFACLLQHGSGSPTPGGDVKINPFSSSDVNSLVRFTASDVGGKLQLTLNDEKNSIEVADPSTPVFLVLQMTLTKAEKNGKSKLRTALYVNPEIDSKWPHANDQKVEKTIPNVTLPKELGLLIRKPPRSGATTRIDEIRFARKATDLSAAPQSNATPAAAAAKN
jgi:eukaryotic-like serine/threonine-protein kinase